GAHRQLAFARSVRVSRYHFPGSPRTEPVVDPRRDRLLDEPHRPVAKQKVRPARMVALESIIDRLVPPTMQRLDEVVEMTEVTGRSIGRIDLAVLEIAFPVQGHDGGSPDSVAVDPCQRTVHVGGAFAREKRTARAIGDLAQGDRLPVAAITENAAEYAAAAP